MERAQGDMDDEPTVVGTDNYSNALVALVGENSEGRRQKQKKQHVF